MHYPTVYLVELFSGSSSVAKAIKHSLPSQWKLRVHSVDIHPKYHPTTATDILVWDYKKVLKDFLASLKPGDIVWAHASPPCTEFSKAKTTAPRDLPLADKLVRRSLRIIKFSGKLVPKGSSFFWTVENPVGLMRTRDYMRPLDKYLNTTSYCKWGKSFRKDTDIWTNVPSLDLPICRKGMYCKQKAKLGHHEVTAQSGPSSSGSRSIQGSGSGENVYPLPSRLISYIFRKALQSLQNSP